MAMYLEQFVESLKFLTKFNKEYRKSNIDFIELKSTLKGFQATETHEMYEQMRYVIEQMALLYQHQIPLEHLVNHCHSISHGFWETYTNHPASKGFTLSVTVGNVYYKGESVYNLTKSKLKQIISKGKVLDEELPVHVWVTLEDMTVFDLTIIPTLIHKGLLDESEVTSNLLVWNEEHSGDFVFEPLLIDNDFMHRVDEVSHKLSV